jgi:2-keto-4-pentenoate hydratase/2-oxohepta-3-ene-1,7-dioic acid hydratase in catechol pathway
MRLVRYATPAGHRVGLLRGAPGAEEVLPTVHTDLLAVVLSGAAPEPTGPPVADVRLLAPVPRPGKIFGSGINYASHQEENPDAVLPDEPGFFAKLPSSVCGPGDAIRLPAPGAHVDYEVELAVVVGRPGRDIAPADAMAHVAGFTVVNDVSDRAVQFRPNQMVLGNGCDTFCPMGPALVTPDEVGDLAGCAVRSVVNGELRQDARVGDMIFDVATLVAHASRAITLEPGDVVTTGTPAGCGTFRDPPLWLRPGDVVEVAVEGVGVLTNPVVAGWSP